MKRKLILLIIVLIVTFVSSILGIDSYSNCKKIQLKSAVLYNSKCSDVPASFSHLEQSLVVNLQVDLINIADLSWGNEDDKEAMLCRQLEKYDILYPDSSIIESPQLRNIVNVIEEFTQKGGSVFLANEFWNVFKKDYIGAGEFLKVDGIKGDFKFPDMGEDLKPLQELVKDFTSLYKKYKGSKEAFGKDYGYGIIGGSAKPLVVLNGVALYTMNKVGNGYVYFTNPLLPNEFNINSLDMRPKKENQKFFSNTSTTCNQMIRSSFAAFISKKKYGFSVERTFGCYGRPSITWQLHYEELSGIKENSAGIISELCQKFLEIPSFAIVRNSYYWFTRFETVTYLLADKGGEPDKNYSYTMDQHENAYSSGKHIAAENRWIQLGKVEKAGSYFKDCPEYCQRAYPCAVKNLENGYVDFLCGADDGYFYYYAGRGFGENYETSRKIVLTDKDGQKLSVGAGSAPVLLDIDGDGIEDIVSGSKKGEIFWFKGIGNWCFEKESKLIDIPFEGQSFPEIGDLNGDGIPDLIIGSNSSQIRFYYGQKNKGTLTFVQAENLSISGTDQIKGNWLAPAIADLDNDGRMDLAIGTVDGYIARFLRNDNNFTFDGYFTGSETNYKGNNNLKFGNNCVPVFFDLNSDGKEDLIVGSLEYGLAYPVDSQYFPYKKELQAQLEDMQKNYYSVDMHFYTKYYASKEYENKEIKEHLQAMKSYGLDTANIGFNQHTWHTSKKGYTQTIDNGLNAGLNWCSGFEPSNSDATPDTSAETALWIPFMYGTGKNNIKDRVIFNSSLFLYDHYGATELSAKYDLPLSVYYHCDFAYKDKNEAERIVWLVADFTRKNHYNFVTEEQFAKSVAASYNTDFSVYMDKDTSSISVKTKPHSKKGRLYDSNYQKAVGVKVVLGDKLASSLKDISINSKVLDRNKNTFYIGSTSSKIEKSKLNKYPELQLVRINTPADISYGKNKITLKFLDCGMMQAETLGPATTSSEGWTATRSDKGGTIFTKYGRAELLEIEPLNIQ